MNPLLDSGKGVKGRSRKAHLVGNSMANATYTLVATKRWLGRIGSRVFGVSVRELSAIPKYVNLFKPRDLDARFI